MGLGDRVVGVTNVCDRPEEARSKTKVGGMTTPSLESIVALKPDLVVMIKEGNPKDVADRLKNLGIRVHVFSSRRLADLPPAIRELGKVLGARGKADVLAGRIESAMRETILHKEAKKREKKALFLISPYPLIVVGQGTIISDAMALYGLENIAADAKISYPEISLETVIERQPEIIIIGSAKGMKKPVEGLLKRLKMVKAVRNGHVFYVGDALYRPGPRIPDGMSELERCLNIP
jgi:iron complex transport system substrate-binding protein